VYSVLTVSPLSQGNITLLRLLNISTPIDGYQIGKDYCVFEEDFEATFNQIYDNWHSLDQEAGQLIGAKQGSGKSLRARYASRKTAELLIMEEASTQRLRGFLVNLGQAINRL
jgi:hypothetical protein